MSRLPAAFPPAIEGAHSIGQCKFELAAIECARATPSPYQNSYGGAHEERAPGQRKEK
jgi:hypothetical protein